MTQAELIAICLNAPADRLAAIEAAARGADRARPGTARAAASILECCPRTVRRYADAGLLTPIRISARRVRYDLNAVERLAEKGAPAKAGV